MYNSQVHLFAPTLEQLIEELISERVEKYFIERTIKLGDTPFHYCKVLTKNHVYDVSVTEGYEHESEVNHVVSRKNLSKRFIKGYFNDWKLKSKGVN